MEFQGIIIYGLLSYIPLFLVLNTSSYCSAVGDGRINVSCEVESIRVSYYPICRGGVSIKHNRNGSFENCNFFCSNC